MRHKDFLEQAVFSTLKTAAAWARAVLDVVFPPRTSARALENVSLEDFYSQVPLSEETPWSNAPSLKIFPLFSYREPLMRRAIWELKYQGNKNVAHILGGLMYEEIIAELSEQQLWNDFRSAIIIPIPLSSERRAERGFNQTELLAKEISIWSKNVLNCDSTILQKIRHTESQTKMSRIERIRNLHDCFAIKESDTNSQVTQEKVRGRCIILLDDVGTTGSTLSEVARTLREAGANKIIAFTVAH